MVLPLLVGIHENFFYRAFIFLRDTTSLHHSCIGRNRLNRSLLLTINTGWPCSCCTGNLSFFTCTASCLSGYSPSGLTAISVQSNNLTCTCSQLTWKKNQQQVPESLNALQAIYYSRRESRPYATADTPQKMGSQLMDIIKPRWHTIFLCGGHKKTLQTGSVGKWLLFHKSQRAEVTQVTFTYVS